MIFYFVDSTQLGQFSKQDETQNSGNIVDRISMQNNNGPPIFTADTLSSPERFIARIGDKFSIFCEATGNPEPLITWFKDSEPINNIIHFKG